MVAFGLSGLLAANVRAQAQPPQAAPGAASPSAPVASPAPMSASTPGAIAPASAPGSAAGDVPPGGGDPYAVRIAKLEERVDQLKEEAWRVKARVDLLKETVLHGVIGGSRALIVHRNKMGSAFKLTRLAYALDGVQIFAKSDDSDHIADQDDITIFDGQIVPGQHTLSVLIVYGGNGYGMFSYLKGYVFTVKSSQAFAAAEGKQTKITVEGYEQGNFTTPLDQRPAVRFDVNVTDVESGAPKAAK